MTTTIFDAARSADLSRLETVLAQGCDLSQLNTYGFTALHCAAMGANSHPEASVVAVIETLVNAGSTIDAQSRDGRTALYLAAEFSNTLGPVEALLAHGANPDVCDAHGNHIVVNACSQAVQALLSRLTGHAVPPKPLNLPSIPLKAGAWREVKLQLDTVFDELANQGLVVLQDAGTTQDDGRDDCTEIFFARGGLAAGLQGLCFYSRQDLQRAKRSSQLALSFWGAPDGQDSAMRKVGQQIVAAFQQAGFLVDWNESARMRPTVVLQNMTQHNV